MFIECLYDGFGFYGVFRFFLWKTIERERSTDHDFPEVGSEIRELGRLRLVVGRVMD